MAVGAFSFDESVGEEALIILAVGEDYFLAVDVSVLVDSPVEFLDEAFVNGTLRASVVVEFYVEGFQVLDEDLMVTVRELAGRDSSLNCLDLNGCSMLVASADEYNVFAFQAEVSGVDVG